jgi:cephalosporin hydroxylase
MRRLKDETSKARDGGALNFEYDHTIECKIAITAAPSGFLKRLQI